MTVLFKCGPIVLAAGPSVPFRRLPLLMFLCLAPLVVRAQSLIEGTALVIDGATLEVAGTRLLLEGIEAPAKSESRQAASVLADKIGQANVRCLPKAQGTALCSVGNIDLGGWMIEQGWATAARQGSPDYRRLEGLARKFGRGMWATSIQMPAD